MNKKLKIVTIILVSIIGIGIIGVLVLHTWNNKLNYTLSTLTNTTTFREHQDEKYQKMNEIVINDTLIGMSEEEVTKQLGKPAKIFEYDDKVYMYNAGHIYKELCLGEYKLSREKHNYALYITFDETNKVKSTIVKERP